MLAEKGIVELKLVSALLNKGYDISALFTNSVPDSIAIIEQYLITSLFY
jgi:hypothetical protein